ncbi:MAG: ABC transporter permease [Vicinamibacteria bacterium]
MLLSYLKLAMKVFLRRRVFTAISLFGITFTLLVLVVATSVLDHATAPVAPETRQERTLCVYSARMTGDDNTWQSEAGYGFFDRYMRGLPGVERMSIFSEATPVASYRNGGRIDSVLKRADGEYWKILDFSFLEGGPFTVDDVANARFVAVINETTRNRFFGGEPAVGKVIEADGQRFQVVGVVPDVPLLRTIPFADIWVPITTAKSDGYKREVMGGFLGIFLVGSPADFPALREELQARLKAVELPDPKMWKQIEAHPYTAIERVAAIFLESGPGRALTGRGEHQLAVFCMLVAGLVLLFMLLPTLNLVNLNVSRILERASEIGVRKAFGASSYMLVGQFVVENVVLTLAGGLVALFLSPMVLQALTATQLVPYAHFTLNHRVFAYGLGFAVVFGVLSGVYPAWRMSRLHPVEALNGGAR